MNTEPLKTSTHPLSPLQQGMLYHSLSARDPGVDIEQVIAELHEVVDAAALEAAWRAVTQRHSILRTSFHWRGQSGPRQQVHPEAVLPFQFQDWNDVPEAERASAFDAWLRADRLRAFDLAQAPLFRLTLFCFGADECRLVWTCHHLLLDGRSIGLVLGEVFMTYDALVRGETRALPPTRPFSDYVTWVEQQAWDGAETFWRGQLKGFTAPTPLVSCIGRPEGEVVEAGKIRGVREMRLSPEVTTALETWAKENSLTFNTVVQGAWALLLSRYTGEEEVVFGAVRACRRSGIEWAPTVAGPFINTVPVRLRVSPELPLLAWLIQLRQQWLSIRPYEHAPLVMIQGWSDVPRGQPLFESLVSFQDPAWEDQLREQVGQGSRRKFGVRGQSNYPLALDASAGETLAARIIYHRHRFDDAVVARMIGHLKAILEGMARDPSGAIKDLPILTGDERRLILKDWNDTKTEPSPIACMHHAFAAQAARTPDRVAVACREETITYHQLNERAGQLAARLRASGVGPDGRVALCLNRSVDLMVGLLGILKAGGCYVPLDPSYPEEWLQFVLNDSEARVLVTEEKLRSRFDSIPVPELRMHLVDSPVELSAHAAGAADHATAAGEARGENLAYVIYTSGSTGRPKGVMVEHRNVLNFFAGIDRLMGAEPGTWMAVTSVSFDISVLELFWTLSRGFTVVLHPGSGIPASDRGEGAAANPWRDLLEQMRHHHVTHLQCTPSLAGALIHLPEAGDVLPALTALLLGGEALPVPLGEKIRRVMRGSFFNMYGPTETTVWSAAHRIEQVERTIPIGRPMANTSIHLLDSRGQPVPIGVTGELSIGGAGVARGYLGRPELTAERFVPDPFDERPGARLYRTGDLGRFREDGAIEFLGRRDHQIKLRGHRIELGEIEAALAGHPGVGDCAVRAWDSADGDQRLAAYVVSPRETAGLAGELRRYLRSKLPEHMVPASYTFLEKLPWTQNGKVNRNALPPPDENRPAKDTAYAPPRTDLEREIAKIWRELLHVKEVGLNDNFFDLGGHSLLVVRVHARLRETLGIDVPIVRLFQRPTISALAGLLSEPEQRVSLNKAQERARRQRAAFAGAGRQEVAI